MLAIFFFLIWLHLHLHMSTSNRWLHQHLTNPEHWQQNSHSNCNIQKIWRVSKHKTSWKKHSSNTQRSSVCVCVCVGKVLYKPSHMITLFRAMTYKHSCVHHYIIMMLDFIHLWPRKWLEHLTSIICNMLPVLSSFIGQPQLSVTRAVH